MDQGLIQIQVLQPVVGSFAAVVIPGTTHLYQNLQENVILKQSIRKCRTACKHTPYTLF